MDEVVTTPSKPTTYTKEQIELIRKYICDGATDDEFKIFLDIAKSVNLNPFHKDIYCIRLKNQMTPMVSIGGLRKIAHRTGLCGEISDRTFKYVLDKDGNPTEKLLSATCSVEKYNPMVGKMFKYTATVYYKEFFANTNMWRNKPHIMLGKCAEAEAIRKAFQAEVKGLYTIEEMEQAGARIKPAQAIVREDMPATRPRPKTKTPVVDYPQTNHVHAARKNQMIEHIRSMLSEICRGMNTEEKLSWIETVLKVKSFKEIEAMNESQLGAVIQQLEVG